LTETVGKAKVEISADLQKLNDGLKKSRSGLKSFLSGLGSFAKGAMGEFARFLANSILNPINLIIKAFAKAKEYGTRFVKGVIEASSSYEQLQLTLKVLLKDQEKANAAFDEARDLAAKTAFSIEEVVGSYAQLLTFGFEQKKIPEVLLLAADAATAFGKNIDEVIHALSYLKAGRSGEALESLARFGITRDALKSKGVEFGGGGELKTSYDKVLEAVYATWKETVGGMSAEGTKTWAGMVSNLKDAWTDFKNEIGKAGFFDAIKGSLKFILDKINEWSANGTLKKWADDISARMTNIYSGVVAIIKEITGLDLEGGKKQLKSAKNMTVEEIGLFVLGMTPQQFKDAIEYYKTGSFLSGSNPDRGQIISDAQRIGEAIKAAIKGELDTGDYFTEALGTGTTAQVPGWAKSILDWIEKIKIKIQEMWDSFSSAWGGKDKRGSRDAHGILPGGFEGIGRQIGEGIGFSISQIDLGQLIKNMINKGETLTEIADAAQSIGGAIGDGIVTGLSNKYPTVSAILKAAFALSGVLNPLGLLGDFEEFLDEKGLRVG